MLKCCPHAVSTEPIFYTDADYSLVSAEGIKKKRKGGNYDTFPDITREETVVANMLSNYKSKRFLNSLVPDSQSAESGVSQTLALSSNCINRLWTATGNSGCVFLPLTPGPTVKKEIKQASPVKESKGQLS